MRNNRVITRIKKILNQRNIEYTTTYINFEHKGKEYEVYKLENNNYRLSIKKGNKITYEDYPYARMNNLISKLILSLEVEDYDDEND